MGGHVQYCPLRIAVGVVLRALLMCRGAPHAGKRSVPRYQPYLADEPALCCQQRE